MAWKILEAISFVFGRDKIERVSLDIDNNDVQIIRYNKNNNDVVVKVNNSIKQTNMDNVEKVIKNKLY